MTDSPSSILGSVTKFEIRCLEPIIMYSVAVVVVATTLFNEGKQQLYLTRALSPR